MIKNYRVPPDDEEIKHWQGRVMGSGGEYQTVPMYRMCPKHMQRAYTQLKSRLRLLEDEAEKRGLELKEPK